MSNIVSFINFRQNRGTAALVLSAGLSIASSAVHGSDYYHMCRSVDGRYIMHDGSLQKTGPNGEGAGPNISYDTKRKIVLNQRSGYCIGSNTGRRHKFEAQTYALDINFWARGQKVNTTVLCELAADGIPAATNCAREVVTANWAISPQTPPQSQTAVPNGNASGNNRRSSGSGGSLWLHNGSVMRLTAQGDIRRIYYDQPRAGLRKRGVRGGELLFEGQRNGDYYSGTAYVFTKRCGKVSYQVSGTVEQGDTRVVMTGDAPKLNASCRQIGSKPDRLVFTLRR